MDENLTEITCATCEAWAEKCAKLRWQERAHTAEAELAMQKMELAASTEAKSKLQRKIEYFMAAYEGAQAKLDNMTAFAEAKKAELSLSQKELAASTEAKSKIIGYIRAIAASPNCNRSNADLVLGAVIEVMESPVHYRACDKCESPVQYGQHACDWCGHAQKAEVTP